MEKVTLFVASSSFVILLLSIRACQTQTTAKPSTLVCPAAEDYDPCGCNLVDENAINNLYSSINCQAKGLNDTKAGQILNSFFLPTVTAVSQVLMNDNRLTHVPSQMYYLKQLSNIDLGSNYISSITKGLFYDGGGDSFFARINNLTLKNNQIGYIEPGSFFGVKGSSRWSGYLDLQNNLLTQFDFHVFHPVLENFKNSKNNHVLVDNNQFDCGGCNLSWLVRDNFELLDFVLGGVCSNGTAFQDLNPYAFSNCEFNCPSTDGNFRNPLDIHSYYKCINDHSFLIDCGELIYVESGQDSGCGLPAKTSSG